MAKLFTPLNVGALELSHRAVVPGLVPMPRTALASRVPMTRENYARCASAGGLIISEPTQISIQGAGLPAARGLHQASHIEEWRTITNAVHARGGFIVAQLWHVGRVAHSSINQEGPVGPSSIPSSAKVLSESWDFVDAEVPRTLDQSGIDGVISDYRAAAANAKDAGFDGVELNGADGYLPDQFLQDRTNTRIDRYGGSMESRTYFLFEVIETLHEVWGADRVGVRLSPFGELNDISDSAPTELFTETMRSLYDRDLAYVHLVRTTSDGHIDDHRLLDRPVAARLRSAFPGVLITSGKYSQSEAIEIVQSRWADAVGISAPFSFDSTRPNPLMIDE